MLALRFPARIGMFLSIFAGFALQGFAGNATAEEFIPESWQRFQQQGPALTLIGHVRTRSAREIKDNSWSIGCETLDRD